MFVGPITLFAIYIVIWWVVLFVILPLGMSQGPRDRPTDGADWGAPPVTNLKRKFFTTTWVAALVWIALVLVVQFQLIPLPDLPSTRPN
ncbi:MAG: DUF1467 family protein [Caulobacterales bacterium]|nr:DUF1467 family protein [Caulobacterales bacterium]